MRWINSRASAYPFRPQTWDGIAEQARAFAESHPECGCLVDVIDSIRECGGQDRLAATWTPNGLLVTPVPIPDPPTPHVLVSFPTTDEIKIEHRATTGHDDRIVRPTTDAVPLFWRFMTEKFGIAPIR